MVTRAFSGGALAALSSQPFYCWKGMEIASLLGVWNSPVSKEEKSCGFEAASLSSKFSLYCTDKMPPLG